MNSPTISVTDEDHDDKIMTDSSHGSDSRRHSLEESHRMNAHAFERASDVESNRHTIYPVISYASQIGGEGGIEDPEHEKHEIGEKDPNLVEWDGPNDPKNPYNW
jgi:hypothetical protein